MSETSLFNALADAVKCLRDEQQKFALVGGMAVAIRGEPRFTRDVDIAVAVSEDSVLETLVSRMRTRGYSVVALVEHELKGRLATVRLLGPTGLVVDLVAASSGIEPEVVQRATLVEIPSIGPIPVACSEDLIAMKVLSMTNRRPHDRLDAIGLMLVNDQLNVELVRQRLQLITERGFDRGENLQSKLEELIEAARSNRA